MSAAVPHRPARWPRVVLAEARALVDPRFSAGVVALGVVLMLGWMGGARALVGDLGVLMFFYPLLHWRGRAIGGSLDEPVPFGAAAHDLVRVACGAVDAALVLIAINAIHLGLFAWEASQRGVTAQVQPGYAATVVAHGLAAYLLGSAVLLCARRPARALPIAFLLGALAMLLGDVQVGTTSLHAWWSEGRGRVERVAFETRLPLGDVLLRVAFAAAAVVAAALAGRRGIGSGGVPSWLRLRVRGVLPAPRPARAASLAVPRRPPELMVVARRQFAVQAGRMAVPMALAALFAAGCLWRETRGDGTFLSGGGWLVPIVFAAFFWPVLVWQDERGSRDWDELHPVDPFTRRLLHAAAGLLWLQLAVLAVVAACIAGAMVEGTLASPGQVPAWAMPGIPVGMVGLYSLGTAWAMLSRHPVRTALIGYLVTTELMVLVDILIRGEDLSLLSPSWVLAPMHFSVSVQDQSLWSGVLWLGIYAVLAVAAIRFRTHRDLHRRLIRRLAQ